MRSIIGIISGCDNYVAVGVVKDGILKQLEPRI